MREAGQEPIALFLSACRAAQLPPDNYPIHKLPDKDFLSEIERRFGADLDDGGNRQQDPCSRKSDGDQPDADQSEDDKDDGRGKCHVVSLCGQGFQEWLRTR